jgi:hypothetical protein
MKRKIFLILTVMAMSFAVYAQEAAPCGPFDDDCTPEGPPEEEIPVDGGVSLLAIAGFAWGIKKLKNNK